MDEAVILGDIGGTNARFALLRGGGIAATKWLAVADYPTILGALEAYIASLGEEVRVAGAILAAAGPVEENRSSLTNSPWVVDGGELETRFGWPRVHVLNDFAATAWALPELAADALAPVGGGTAIPDRPAAVLGPGTGLGLACFLPTRVGPVVLDTEGGHVTLAALSPREDAVIGRLRRRFGHVSAERVLSGAGLVNLHDTVAALDGIEVPERTPAEVMAAAQSARCPASVAALDMFCRFLGDFAGNAALTFGARGGVFIAGGIVPRAIDHLRRSDFRERFEAKGRYQAYLSAIPTRVITDPDPAFAGLRGLAAREFGV